MKRLTFVLGLFCLLFSSGSIFAADTERDSFETSIYGISEISHFHADPARMNQLSAETRADIVRAKSVLVNALKAVQDKNGKPQKYLSVALNKQFPTKQQFAQSLMDEETSLIALLVDDFTVSKDETQVVFHCSVIVSSEGSITAADRSATLQKTGQDWKLASFKSSAESTEH